MDHRFGGRLLGEVSFQDIAAIPCDDLSQGLGILGEENFSSFGAELNPLGDTQLLAAALPGAQSHLHAGAGMRAEVGVVGRYGLSQGLILLFPSSSDLLHPFWITAQDIADAFLGADIREGLIK